MAATIRLITYNGQTVVPRTDGIIQDASIGQNGIFYGCEVTSSGNIINISGGYGIIKGRYFEIDASTVPITLATTDTLLGRLYIRLDLSNTESPIQILTETDSSLSPLEQNDDANYVNGVWEMEMATFTVTTTEVIGLTETYESITDNGTLINALQGAVDTLNSKIGSISITGPFSVSQDEGIDFSLPNNYRGVVTIHDSNAGKNGIYMVYANVAGAVGTKTISAANDVTLVTSYTNRFHINPTSGTRAVMMINVSGTAIKS